GRGALAAAGGCPPPCTTPPSLGGAGPAACPDADPANEFTPGEHGYHHVDVHATGEQSLCLRALRQGINVDDLYLPSAQGFHIAHQGQRQADAGAAADMMAPGRSEPLGLAGSQVEQMYDDTWDTEQVPQPHECCFCNGSGLLRSNNCLVDVAQNP